MLKKMRKAQTMVEYIIIVCLIAVSLIAVFSYLARGIGKKAAYATQQLSNEEGSKAEDAYSEMGEGKDAIKELE